jgi:hypothetical protein
MIFGLFNELIFRISQTFCLFESLKIITNDEAWLSASGNYVFHVSEKWGLRLSLPVCSK